jgi:hypothetical protein
MLLLNLNLRRGSDVLPDDGEPQEFCDLDAARVEAIESLRELAAFAIREGRAFAYTGIDIVDQNGLVLVQVSTSDAVPLLKLDKLDDL